MGGPKAPSESELSGSDGHRALCAAVQPFSVSALPITANGSGQPPTACKSVGACLNSQKYDCCAPWERASTRPGWVKSGMINSSYGLVNAESG